MTKNLYLLVFLLLTTTVLHAQNSHIVKIITPLGKITVQVDTLHAPVTAKNFLRLIQAGTYEKASFYRVVRMDNQPQNKVKIEVIQGGIYPSPEEDKIPAIAHETTEITGILHKNGTISMARNAPGSASTEFFICIGDQPDLDYGGKRNPDGQGFAAFGQVTNGMDIVRKIQKLKDEGQMLLRPVPVRMELVD